MTFDVITFDGCLCSQGVKDAYEVTVLDYSYSFSGHQKKEETERRLDQ